MNKKSTLFAILSGFLLVLASCSGKTEKLSESGSEKSMSEKTEESGLPKIPITATDEDYCRVLFTSGRSDTGGLYSIGSNGKGLKRLCTAYIYSTVRVSPDGKRYAFHSKVKDMSRFCQAVYDSERDTLIKLEMPDDGLGWYPRWWDNDHIYYRSRGYVYKQNIHSGGYEKITKEKIKYALDPIWVPEMKKFVNVEDDRVCTFNIDGSGYDCDSLPVLHQTEYPPVFVNKDGTVLIGFETNPGSWKSEEAKPPSKFVLADLKGRINFEAAFSILDWTGNKTTVDANGKWVYHVENIKENGKSIYILKRSKVIDVSIEQTVYVKFRAINAISVKVE